MKSSNSYTFPEQSIPLLALICFLWLSFSCSTGDRQGAAETSGATWMDNLVYPENSGVVDVTKPPYNADNTGNTDVSSVLIEAATFARNENRILYFPNGTYLVSNTIVFDTIYNWSHYSAPGFYLNNCDDNAFVRYHGQNRDKTILKLADNAPGYGETQGKGKAVLSTITPGMWSNIGFNVEVCNMTISSGKGNPGATGLLFNGSNTAAIRNVRIVSGDGQGKTGLDLFNSGGPGIFRELEIEGFDIGILREAGPQYYILEHVRLANQNKAGISTQKCSFVIRDLQSRNIVPAVINRNHGHLVLIDAELTGEGPHGGKPAGDVPAIISGMEEDGCEAYLFARNLACRGYGISIDHNGKRLEPDHIPEFSSHGSYSLLKSEANTPSLNLPVRETPVVPWDPPSEWACVDDFGAIGNDTIDDTEAFQAAMNSGASTIYASNGKKYLISNTITIGGNVRRVNLLWAQLKVYGKLNDAEKPMFRLLDGQHPTVVFEKSHVWHFEGNNSRYTFIDQATKRTLVLKDLHIHRGVTYWNSVPGGTVFFENVKGKTRDSPGNPYSFNFNGVKVWARSFNPDGGHHVRNNGSFLWILGFKTEDDCARFTLLNNSVTEILGGSVWSGSRTGKYAEPVILNDNSHVSACFMESKHPRAPDNSVRVLVRESVGWRTEYLRKEDLPQKVCSGELFYRGTVVPLYAGYERDEVNRLLNGWMLR